ncbi:MAG: FAD-dependent oxidoreductase [Gemmatimonadota bacterium]
MQIAVVGSGVAGLVVAHRLHPRHQVTLFEADDRIGGHVHTVPLAGFGALRNVDTGFIVYNETNYPRFTALLAELGVATEPTSMSFSVRADATDLEYNGSSIEQLFVQRRNLVRPSFYRMLRDIARFNRAAPRDVESGRATGTLGEYLDANRYGIELRRDYLIPMGSALWSLPPASVLEMPVVFFVQFFSNHGMLSVNRRPEWRVVSGGSQRYVDALVAPFRDRIRLETRVTAVRRSAGCVTVNGERFDQVVLACHSDDALAMLADPTSAENEVLGALPYQENDVVLHSDDSLLPKRRAAWGSWNYLVGNEADAPAIVTYNMNMLQGLEAPVTFCVSLNASERIRPESVYRRLRYRHPVYTVAGMAAQARHHEISTGRTHYCGAYWGYGFHEDGVRSADRVVAAIEAGA